MTDKAQTDKGGGRCSVFLTPAREDFARLEEMIAELCREYGSPPFEPHLTVYSGNFPDPDILERCVEKAISGESPLSLRVKGVGCSADFFKTLFIELEEHPLLRRIHDRVREGCGGPSGYILIPHLSLLYADIPLAEKEALAARTVVDAREISFDRVKVVTPLNREEGWRDTVQWHTSRKWRLSG